MYTQYKVYREEDKHQWCIGKSQEPVTYSTGKCECLENKGIPFTDFDDAIHYCEIESKRLGEQCVIAY